MRLELLCSNFFRCGNDFMDKKLTNVLPICGRLLQSKMKKGAGTSSVPSTTSIANTNTAQTGYLTSSIVFLCWIDLETVYGDRT